MRKFTFRGGIHPKDSKEMTKDKPITKLSPPKKLIYPLIQHIGAPLTPIVSVGDTVCVGQKLGDSDAFVSVPVHSGVSGKVVAIQPHIHPSGQEIMSVTIENDGDYTICEDIKPKGDYRKISKEELVKAVREAGIVGMGGAAFPTHVKLVPPKGTKIDYTIINGAECEPYLTSDHRVMLEDSNDVIGGLKIIMHIMGLDKGYIAIEENKKNAIEALENVLKNDSSVEICVLKTKYPQGSEKHLIKAITGREVQSGKLPSDSGVVVFNIDTCTAIYRAVTFGMPLIRRIVTVSGSAVKKPCNLEVIIGTPFKDVFAAVGGIDEDTAKIVMGGPMMGIAQYSLETPVIKGTSGLLAFKKSEIQGLKEGPCVKCGKCVFHCPVGIMPNYIAQIVKSEDFETAEKLNAADCIECGVCSYVCPTKRHVTQSVRQVKTRVLERRRENAAKKEEK